MRRLSFTIIAAALFSPLGAKADHPMRDRDLEMGAALYQEACASCHGVALEGQPNWRSRNADGTLRAPPHDVTGHTWHHDDALLFEYTKFGGKMALASRGMPDFNSGMPAFSGSYSDSEIWTILAFIRSSWPQEAQDIQTARNPGH